MKLKDLKVRLDSLHLSERCLESEISIILTSPSMGPRAMCGVKNCGFGFDWENGHFLLTPASDLVVKSERQALWDAAHDFIYMLSQETRTYRGVEKETPLAKRAKAIMEKSRKLK